MMDPARNPLLRMLGIAHPIVQGPMNGASPAGLVAAVSDAGGLGSMAAALLSPESILAETARVRAMTGAPFAVNLFVLGAARPHPAVVAAAQSRLERHYRELGMDLPVAPARYAEHYPDQLAALAEAAPPVVSFTFGLVDADAIAHFKRLQCVVIGTATTVAEALAWQERGADVVCAQGAEAGGHRATFLGDFEQSAIGLMALLPQMRRALRIPVVAAGGIMDGTGIAAAMVLGAHAAQLGTAFLATPESGIAPAWRDAIASARDDGTRLTRVFSGRPARGLVNRYMEAMRGEESCVPDYPVQNALTGALRAEAARQGRADWMSLWAGQAAALARPMGAAELVALLASELDAVRAGCGFRCEGKNHDKETK